MQNAIATPCLRNMIQPVTRNDPCCRVLDLGMFSGISDDHLYEVAEALVRLSVCVCVCVCVFPHSTLIRLPLISAYEPKKSLCRRRATRCCGKSSSASTSICQTAGCRQSWYRPRATELYGTDRYTVYTHVLHTHVTYSNTMHLSLSFIGSSCR